MSLHLDWCSHEAAKYAVEHWHYSRCMPAGKSVKIGVWENEKYIGCIIYSLGAGNMTDGRKYGLKKSNDICELSRIALTNHVAPVSKMISISIKMLKQQSPLLRMIISFSDEMGQGHFGGVYQAANFIYTGAFEGDGGFTINGKHYHNRSVYSKGWVQQLSWLQTHIDPNTTHDATRKHRYLYPLDDAMRKQIEPLRKPYPKRGRGEIDNAPQSNEETGGASPTRPL
jgi:hypothetical protein